MDQSGDDFALDFGGNRDGEMRHAVEEVGGAVQRIDDPARLGFAADDFAGFLHQQPPVGPSMGQDFGNRLLGGTIGVRHEISRALAADLQGIDFVEIAAQSGCGLARRLFHHGDQGGMGNQGFVFLFGICRHCRGVALAACDPAANRKAISPPPPETASGRHCDSRG